MLKQCGTEILYTNKSKRNNIDSHNNNNEENNNFPY